MPEGVGNVIADTGARVFVSYSREDIQFAQEIRLAIAGWKFDPILDVHGIDGGDDWRSSLRALILSSDTVVFVLTEKSADSPACAWELAEASKLGKRLLVVTPHVLPRDLNLPPQLAEIQWILCYRDPSAPGSGFVDGLQRLEKALRVDLDWLHEQTRLSVHVIDWSSHKDDARLLRGGALEDALAWLSRAPFGATIPPEVKQYIDLCDAAERRRATEARAQLAEREAALNEAEAANVRAAAATDAKDRADEKARAANAKADRRARLIMLIAVSGPIFLLGAAGIGYAALNNAVVLAKVKSKIWAAQAEGLMNRQNYAEAMLMALGGDPAEDGRWEVRLSHPKTGFEQARSALKNAYEHNRLLRIIPTNATVNAVAFSPDGLSVLAALNSGGAELWRIADREPVATFAVGQGAIQVVVFSPDGRTVLTGGADGLTTLWPISGGNALVSFQGRRGGVTAAAFAADGATVLIGYQNEAATLWRTTGGEISSFRSSGGPVLSVARLSEGSALIGTRLKPATKWGPRRKGAALPVSGDPSIRAVSFSQDGNRVATGSADGTIKVRNIDGTVISTFNEGLGRASAIALAGDGSRVLAALSDGTAKLWLLDGSDASMEFVGHDGIVHSAAFSSTGEWVATGGDDEIRIWTTGAVRPFSSDDPNKQVRTACTSLAEIGLSTLSKQTLLTYPLAGQTAQSAEKAKRGNPCRRMQDRGLGGGARSVSTARKP